VCDECVEQIDIFGGPSRSARVGPKDQGRKTAEAWRWVTDPARHTTACWPRCAAAASQPFGRAKEVRPLGQSAHRRVRTFAVAAWMRSEGLAAGGAVRGRFPEWVAGRGGRSTSCAYGENPHQRAALYVDDVGGPVWTAGRQLHGKGDVLQQTSPTPTGLGGPPSTKSRP